MRQVFEAQHRRAPRPLIYVLWECGGSALIRPALIKTCHVVSASVTLGAALIQAPRASRVLACFKTVVGALVPTAATPPAADGAAGFAPAGRDPEGGHSHPLPLKPNRTREAAAFLRRQCPSPATLFAEAFRLGRPGRPQPDT